jgi:hypothetical protein
MSTVGIFSLVWFGNAPLARHGAHPLFRHGTCTVRREPQVCLLWILATRLKGQVDERADLEGQVLAAGIKQIQGGFLPIGPSASWSDTDSRPPAVVMKSCRLRSSGAFGMPLRSR